MKIGFINFQIRLRMIPTNSGKKSLLLFSVILFLFLMQGVAPLKADSAQNSELEEQFSPEAIQTLSLFEKFWEEKAYDDARQQLELVLKHYPDVPKLHLLKANLIKEQSGVEDALDYLTLQISDHPEHYGFVAARAQFLLNNGYLESARLDFYKAYEAGYRPSDILMVLSDIEKEKGDLPTALTLIEQALEVDAKDSGFWFKKAQLELKLGKVDEAATSCYNAATLAPGDIQYHKLYLEILIYRKQVDEFKSYLNTLHKRFPGDSWVSLRMSSLLVEQGDFAKAIEVLQTALEDNPADHLMMFQLATIYAGIRKWDESLDYFKAGLALDPDSDWAYVQMGKVYLQNNQLDSAVTHLEKAMELETKDPFVYETLARIYNRKNDTFEAERIILAGLQNQEKNQNLILEYANLLEKRGNSKETTKAYEEALKNDPDNAFILGKLGNLYRVSKSYDKSLDMLQRAMALKGDSGWIKAYYIETLADLKQWEKALKEIDNLLQMIPDDYWAFAKKSLIEYEIGRLEQAHRSIQKASQLNPDADWLKEHEGRILEGLGKYEAAEKAFNEALQRSPDSSYLLTRLAYVQVHTDREEALVNILQALEADDFNLATIELYLFLSGKAPQYWGFRETSQEYRVYEQIIKKAFKAVEKDLAGLSAEKSVHFQFLTHLLKRMKNGSGADHSLDAEILKESLSEWHRFYLGLEAMSLDDWELARAHLEKAYRMNGDNPWVVSKLAYVYQQLTLHNKAIEMLNRFLKLRSDDDYIWAQLRLALNYDLAKEYVNSERVYKQILEKKPKDNIALNNLAWMYLNAKDTKLHKLDDALKLALKAVEIQPSSANLDTLAEAYYQKKDYGRALKTIERALDRDRRGLDDFKKTKKKIIRAMEEESKAP